MVKTLQSFLCNSAPRAFCYFRRLFLKKCFIVFGLVLLLFNNFNFCCKHFSLTVNIFLFIELPDPPDKFRLSPFREDGSLGVTWDKPPCRPSQAFVTYYVIEFCEISNKICLSKS